MSNASTAEALQNQGGSLQGLHTWVVPIYCWVYLGGASTAGITYHVGGILSGKLVQRCTGYYIAIGVSSQGEHLIWTHPHFCKPIMMSKNKRSALEAIAHAV